VWRSVVIGPWGEEQSLHYLPSSPPHPPHSTQQVVSDTVASVVQKEVESSIKLHAGKLGSEARLQEERKRKEVCV